MSIRESFEFLNFLFVAVLLQLLWKLLLLSKFSWLLSPDLHFVCRSRSATRKVGNPSHFPELSPRRVLCNEYRECYSLLFVADWSLPTPSKAHRWRVTFTSTPWTTLYFSFRYHNLKACLKTLSTNKYWRRHYQETAVMTSQNMVA